MWLILTIIFAVLTYVTAILFDSMIPAVLFLVAALIFMFLTWNNRSKGR